MKLDATWIVVAGVVAATVLLVTMSARASGRGEGDVVEASSTQAAGKPSDQEGTVLLELGETLGGETPTPVAGDSTDADAQALLAELLAATPPAGWQLPAPAALDTSDWQTVVVGHASMRVPRDWTEQNHIGAPGDEDETVGLSPPAQDLYIELRQIRNSDNDYMQTVADHARDEFARSPGRLAEGVIFGFQPVRQGLAVGGLEVMNQFGKEVDEDGNPTFRLVYWRGRWRQDGKIQRAEFNATFAQDRYEDLAPLVAAILATVTAGPATAPE